MAIDFPNSPALYDTHTSGSRTWQYDGEKWVLVPSQISLDDLSDVDLTVSPVIGDALIFDGSIWTSGSVASGGGNATIEVSDTPPASPEEGDLWFDSTDATTYIYYDSFWVDINGQSIVTPNVEELANVDISFQNEGDVLVYIAARDEWVNVPIYAANPRTSVSLTSSTATEIGRFPLEFFKSAEFTVELEQGEKTTATKVMVVHNGTTTGSSQFGTASIGSPAISATFSTDISGTAVRLLVSVSDAATANVNVTTSKVMTRHLHN